MWKSVATIAGAMLAVMALMLLPPRNSEAVAESAGLLIMAVDYDVVPGQIDNFLAAVKENGTASVKEPGCRELNVAVSQKDPNHVFIFEVYDNAAALEAHLATEHFKKYKGVTKDMVAKREARPLWSVAMNIKGM
jgi:(4S)-4-hydroxy-5-phosphonooxypentane-2,3-dione isomerase